MRALQLVAVAATFMVAGASSSPLTAQQDWEVLAPPASPPARWAAGFVWHPVRNEAVLFGGSTGTQLLADMWTWNGISWTPISASGPTARAHYGLVYDEARGVLVLFGGFNSGGYLNDTWTWDGTSWTLRNPAQKPSGRAQFVMAYDAARQKTVLFGGFPGGGVGVPVLGDTWTWDGTNWSQESTAVAPPPRDLAVMAYDSARSEVVLHGGEVSINGASLNDTWVWDGVTWTEKFPTVSPTGSVKRGVAYDALRERTVVFGGRPVNGPSPYLLDTWEWDGTEWSQACASCLPRNAALSGQPQGVEIPAAAFDRNLNRVVVFGGSYHSPGVQSSRLDSTWAFSLNGGPTADAGADQAAHVGDVAVLNGAGSFDDNTPAALLEYSWSWVSRPAGSQAVLAFAATATPSFLVDLPGTYDAQLIVTDEAGLVSAADQVQVSSDNLAPSAVAGHDQLVITGTTVALDGSASSDPENDPLSFAWSFDSLPGGSQASLSGAGSALAQFIPDAEGVYELRLEVSDFIGPGTSDTVRVTATTALGFAESKVATAASILAGLTPGQVTNKGNQNALLNFLGQVIVALQAGDSAEAVSKLQKSMERTDGCVLRGAPDGNGSGRDWVTDCTTQVLIYGDLSQALSAISP